MSVLKIRLRMSIQNNPARQNIALASISLLKEELERLNAKGGIINREQWL